MNTPALSLLAQNIIAWFGGTYAVEGMCAKVKSAFGWAMEKFPKFKSALCRIAGEAHLTKFIGYLSSALVSIALPAIYLPLTHQFSWPMLGLMAASIWATASGRYDQYHPKGQE